VKDRRLLRVTLALVVAMGHLAGAGVAPSAAGGTPASTYYCCCPGECHCTADCCNHGPARPDESRPPIMREGAGVPAWQSQKSCGTSLGTIQRPPSQSKVLFTPQSRQTLEKPSWRWQRPRPLAVVHSSTASLSRSSPRAPPTA
jgi:hypothetical protein